MEEVVLKVKVEGAGDGEAKIKTVKQQLREAKEAALQAKEGTEEYFAALQKAAGLADQLQDVNKAINALNPGDKAAAFGNLINGIAGGFQTITGLYGLLGQKSEDVEKLLLRVQAASALAMGIQSLVEAGKQWKNIQEVIKATTLYQNINTLATKGAAVAQRFLSTALNVTSVSLNTLKAAIVTTGIGALAVGIGVLIYKIMDWTDSTEKQTEAQEKLNKATEKYLEDAGKLADIADTGRSREEQRLKSIITLLNAQGAPRDKIIKAELDLLTFQENAAKERAAFYASDTTAYTKEEIKRRDLATQIASKQLELAKFYVDTKIKLEKEANDKATKSEKDITEDYGNEVSKRQEADLKEYNDSIALKRLKRDEVFAIEDETTIKIKEELQKRRDAERAADDERAASEQQAFEDKKQRIEAGILLAQAAANSLNTLNDIILQNEKQGLKEGEVLSIETQKKAFKRAQALALVQTTINGAQAISSILGQYPKFDGGFAMVAALVSATAAIASQYAVIASQRFTPDGGSGGTPPSPPAPSGFTPPSIQPPQNTSGFLQQDEQNFKVYVVESDITNTQQGVQQNKKKALLTI